jgi:cytochrome c biogenesis protein CcmG/thiol:disulfide interchange protein DsbE
MFISLGIGTVVAVALITVVSLLTGGRVTNNAAGPKNELVGTHVKNFSLPGLKSAVTRLPWRDHQSTVLVFFASWCPPCKGEIPRLATYVRTHQLGSVHVLGIDANDEHAAATSFVAKDDVTFPVGFDANGTVTAQDFNFLQLPETVFVNAKGVITGVHIGGISTAAFAKGIKSIETT